MTEIATLDPLALRAAEAARMPPVTQPLHRVEDTDIGGVPVRVYTPAQALGVIVYLHGGAFFLGSLDTHDHVARALANETRCTVISAGYRLAPEHPFPAGLEDCLAVCRAAGPVAVAGESSGANLAAVIAALAPGVVTHQILYYPSLDLDFDVHRYPSLRENAVGHGLQTAALKPFNAFYLDSGADPDDPRVSPIKRTDLTGLPPALIVTAEYDPLRDEGELYGQRLKEAGVAATVTRISGAGHGFLQHRLDEYTRVLRATREFLR
jgi:acetyl esterase